MRPVTAIVVLSLIGTLGCRDELLADLDETSANEIIARLGDRGIDARKVEAGRGRFAVQVPAGTTLDAVHVLHDAGLPRGGDTRERARSIVPSPAEDHVLLQRSTAADLRETLLAIPGIVDARVIVSLPRAQLGVREPTPPRASAVVRFAGDKAPITPDDVRRVVAGAVPGMAPEAVEVLLTGSQVSRDVPKIVQVGPLAVHERSAAATRYGIAGLLGAIMALGAFSAFGHRVRRTGR